MVTACWKTETLNFCQKKSIGHPVCHFMKIEFECGNEEKMGDIFNFNFKLIPFGSAKFAALAKSQMPRWAKSASSISNRGRVVKMSRFLWTGFRIATAFYSDWQFCSSRDFRQLTCWTIFRVSSTCFRSLERASLTSGVSLPPTCSFILLRIPSCSATQ